MKIRFASSAGLALRLHLLFRCRLCGLTLALPTADIAVGAQPPGPNDQFRGSPKPPTAAPAELARQGQSTLGRPVPTAWQYHPAVKIRTAGNNTYPIYAKMGSRIESWRMRSTSCPKARDAGQLSELIGKLQQTMAIGGPPPSSPET